MTCNKTNSDNNCTCSPVSPVWFEKEPNNTPSSSNTLSERKVKLKKFLELCNDMETSLTDLIHNGYDDDPVEEYYNFKQELIKIRNKTVLKAYESDCFEWKF